MSALPQFSSQDFALQTGRVQATVQNLFMVVGSFGMVRAERAAGCLLAPQQNDLVLLMLGQDKHYVLHVLEREERSERTDSLLLPPRTIISTVQSQSPHKQRQGCESEKEAQEGEESFTLQLSTHSLNIQANNKINMGTKAMHMQAQGMSLFASVLHMRGGILQKSFASIRTVAAHMFLRVAKSVSLFDKKIERVDGLWDAKAKRVQVQAENTLRLGGEDTQIRARETASMDAKHINIG